MGGSTCRIIRSRAKRSKCRTVRIGPKSHEALRAIQQARSATLGTGDTLSLQLTLELMVFEEAKRLGLVERIEGGEGA